MVAAALLMGCSVGTRLMPERVEDPALQGTYTLIVYGLRHYEDVNNFAFLDVEGDAYELVPFTPKFDYKVFKGLGGPEALRRAGELLGTHREYYRISYRGISDPSGRLVALELRPMYIPYYGDDNLLYSMDYYLVEGGRIKIFFRGGPLFDVPAIFRGSSERRR